VKRVLYVSYIFPPMVAGGAPRAHQFCKYLPEHGWAPTVLTGPVAAGSAVDDAALGELPDCVEVVRADCPLAARGARGAPDRRRGLAGIARRAAQTASRLVLVPDRQVLWKRRAVRAGLAALGRARHEAVLATFGPGTNLLVGRRLAEASGLPLVVDFRDLWADLPHPVFPTPLHRSFAGRLERRAVAAASRIVAVSERMAAHLAERHGRRPEEAAAITNGFDPADAGRVRDERGPAADGRPFRLCYTGSVYGQYDLGPFLDVLGGLLREGTVDPAALRVEFTGNFPPEEAARRGLSAVVECRPHVPHAGVFEAFARADALLMIEAPGYWAEFSYAAKVFDYLLPGKPVLALVEPGGNSARLLEAAGLGRVAHPADRAAIRRALLDCLALKGAPPKAMDISRPPLAGFDRRRLAGKLAAVLDDAADAGRAQRQRRG